MWLVIAVMALKSLFQQVKYDEIWYINDRCQLWIEEKKRKNNSRQSAKLTSVMCYSDIIYAHELAEKWVVLVCMYVFWLDSKLVIWRNCCRSHSHHEQFTWKTRGKQMLHIHHHQPYYHVQTPHGLMFEEMCTRRCTVPKWIILVGDARCLWRRWC